VNALATASAPWTETEFEKLDLGDARLNKRARILMDRFTANPTASVPKACRGWGETMAAYRFFDNERIDWRARMAPHWQQTEQRMASQPVVLCLQDTTEGWGQSRQVDKRRRTTLAAELRARMIEVA
jgi:hypothetical protein